MGAGTPESFRRYRHWCGRNCLAKGHLGHTDTLAYESWPEADESLLVDEQVTLVVQVNGKRRGEIQMATDATRDSIEQAALALDKVQSHLQGREPKKVIVVPGRLVNVVG